MFIQLLSHHLKQKRVDDVDDGDDENKIKSNFLTHFSLLHNRFSFNEQKFRL